MTPPWKDNTLHPIAPAPYRSTLIVIDDGRAALR
jgi:hypothetical protein